MKQQALAQTVRDLIGRVDGELGAMSREVGALPVYRDVGGCVMLRPDLSVVVCDWDSYETRVADSVLARRTRYRAGQMYPELESLLPDQPPGANACPKCGGTGENQAVLKDVPSRIKRRLGAAAMCAECAGLGWIG